VVILGQADGIHGPDGQVGDGDGGAGVLGQRVPSLQRQDRGARGVDGGGNGHAAAIAVADLEDARGDGVNLGVGQAQGRGEARGVTAADVNEGAVVELLQGGPAGARVDAAAGVQDHEVRLDEDVAVAAADVGPREIEELLRGASGDQGDVGAP